MKRKVALIGAVIILLVMSTAASCKPSKIQESLCTEKICVVVFNNENLHTQKGTPKGR